MKLPVGIVNAIKKHPEYSQTWRDIYGDERTPKEDVGLGFVGSQKYASLARQRNGFVEVTLVEKTTEDIEAVLVFGKIKDHERPTYFEFFPNSRSNSNTLYLMLADILKFKATRDFPLSNNTLDLYDTHDERKKVLACMFDHLSKREFTKDYGPFSKDDVMKRRDERNDTYMIKDSVTVVGSRRLSHRANMIAWGSSIYDSISEIVVE